MLENKYYNVLKKNIVLIYFMGILFVAVPIILVILYELAKDPELLKLLKFDPEHSTFFNMFLSSYTHEKWDIHLIPNLENYYLLISLIFLFEMNRNRLYLEMALLFLILPFVITTIYIIFHANSGLGISGINFGLNGYLLHCMYGYLKQNRNISTQLIDKRNKIDLKRTPMLFMMIFASVISLQRLLDILSLNVLVHAHSIGYSFGILTPFLVDFILTKYANEN